MTDSVLDELAAVNSRLTSLSTLRDHLQGTLCTLESELESLHEGLKCMEESSLLFKKALDLVYEHGIGELEKVLNTALQYIYFDQDYRIKITPSEGLQKSMEMVLQDCKYDPPLECSLWGGVGNGVRVTMSFILHTYFLVSHGNYPVLFVDEAYHPISEAYVDRFYDFVKSLCKSKGFALVMISHDEKNSVYADKIYRVNEGRVVEMKWVKSGDHEGLVPCE
jgi:DNA repair exonuclease SbcCD ATPase subunit